MKFRSIFPAALVPFTEEGKIDFGVWEDTSTFSYQKEFMGCSFLEPMGRDLF